VSSNKGRSVKMGSSEWGRKREPKECSLRWLGGKAWPCVIYDPDESTSGSLFEGGTLERTVWVRVRRVPAGRSRGSWGTGGRGGLGSWVSTCKKHKIARGHETSPILETNVRAPAFHATCVASFRCILCIAFCGSARHVSDCNRISSVLTASRSSSSIART
jgi:hypothetical protein